MNSPTYENHFTRIGDLSIEESLGFYGPRTLISAQPVELDASSIKGRDGIHVEHDIQVERESAVES